MAVSVMVKTCNAGLPLPLGGVALSLWANLMHDGETMHVREDSNPGFRAGLDILAQSPHRSKNGQFSLVAQTFRCCWRIWLSGGQYGKARDSCCCERALCEPCREPVKVDGRRGDHALQARLGQPAVAGAPQPEAVHALRDRAFDTLALSIRRRPCSVFPRARAAASALCCSRPGSVNWRPWSRPRVQRVLDGQALQLGDAWEFLQRCTLTQNPGCQDAVASGVQEPC